jgi:predicted nucleic-acid-binding protein
VDDADYIDANVILRVLLDDDPEMSRRAERYLDQAGIRAPLTILMGSTLSEVVFVLRGHVYAYSREQIASAVDAILQLPVTIPDRAAIELALEFYRHHHNDWDDSLLAGYAVSSGSGRVVSFDRGLARIPGVTRIEPG